MKWIALLVIGVTTLTTGSLTQRRGSPDVPAAQATQQPRRIEIVSPQPLALTGTERDLAISPDGTRVVYVGGGAGGQLMIRATDQLDAVPLRGATDARSPFVSPDGQWVGFFTATELRKVPIAGGTPVSLCRISGIPRGASWGPDSTIVFATGGDTGLFAISAAGGEPKVLTTPAAAHGENHVFPSVLPGGRAVLFTIRSGSSIGDVAVLDLKTGQRKMLIAEGMQPEYVETGHLVYAAGSALRAVRFDPARLEILSESVRVLAPILMRNSNLGAAEYALSRQGTLVYVPGGQTVTARSLVWVNRQGQEEPISAAPPRGYLWARVSPDGTQVALDIRDQPDGIWIWDVARKTLTRLTDGSVTDKLPLWTPDGRRIVFARQMRAGVQNVFSRTVNHTGTVQRLTTTSNLQAPTSISPDGTRLIVRESAQSGNELRVLRLMGGSQQTEPLALTTTLSGTNAELSPDGHWLAYQSNESGQNQIYVRPFPNVDRGRWQITTGGGTKPVWARNGRELFYLDNANAMTVVPVQTTPTFKPGTATTLFAGPYFGDAAGVRAYDVSPDGQRFLMIRERAAGEQASTPASMIVIVNWHEELKQRVPTR